MRKRWKIFLLAGGFLLLLAGAVGLVGWRFGVLGPRHSIIAVLHLRGIDAINLELTDVTWRWRLCGYDSYALEEGRLARQGDRIVLKAPIRKKGFRWPGTGIFYTQEHTPEVTLVLGADGSATVTGQLRRRPGRLGRVGQATRPTSPAG